MIRYREILRLKSLEFSERNIAHSCGVSRNTITKVVKRALKLLISEGMISPESVPATL